MKMKRVVVPVIAVVIFAVINALPAQSDTDPGVSCAVSRMRFDGESGGTEYWTVTFKLTNSKDTATTIRSKWQDWSWGGGYSPISLRATVAADSSARRKETVSTPGGQPDIRLAHCHSSS